MKTVKFEIKLTVAYIVIGGLWILFSDKILYLLIADDVLRQDFQTYKGWFYVLATALLFYFFIKKHLNKLLSVETELKQHRENLQFLVDEKTRSLKSLNDTLQLNNEEIKNKNEELKIAMKNLKDTQSKLMQADKMASLGILTAGIAHEINNPLNYIMGSYEGLSNYFHSFGSLNERKTDFFLRSMKEGVDRASEIIKSLNSFSRDNTDYDELCDIHKVIDDCLMILQNRTKNRIAITKNFYPERLLIKGNVGKLHQMFLNIIFNAIQAIEDIGEIEIVTASEEDRIEVKIIDNGCGISEENLMLITDPFFTTKPPGEGTGLGLSITYSIVKDHSGTISFQSEVDVGTTVILCFPLDNTD